VHPASQLGRHNDALMMRRPRWAVIAEFGPLFMAEVSYESVEKNPDSIGFGWPDGERC
jgi:hypothetical protein